MEMGAGTFHPVPIARIKGAMDYRLWAALAPTDRWALWENPNRFSIISSKILKPSPDDIQQLYLDSLQVLGIDLMAHDIRFVEDDWKADLGAWGLAGRLVRWMEVSQFTYFQQVGGIDSTLFQVS